MDRKKFIKTGLLAVSGFYFLNAHLFQAMQPKTDSLEGKVIDAPILIVGSGYGGAVSALRLCEAGKKVVMLEMGLNWEKSGIPFSSMLNPAKVQRG